MSWLDDFLASTDPTDPKNLPKSNVEEPSPFAQSQLGRWYNSQSSPSFDERVADLKNTTLDANGDKIDQVPTSRLSSKDLAAYSGNLDFLGLPAQASVSPQILPSQSNPVTPLPPEIVKHLMAKKAASEAPSSSPLKESDGNTAITDRTLPAIPQQGLLDKFSPEVYAKAKADADERNSGLGWSQFAAGVGSALARRDPSEVNAQFDKIRANNIDQTVGEFNRQKASAVADIDTKNKIDDNDPTSRKSQLIQDMVTRLYPKAFDPDLIKTLTAADSSIVMKPIELKAKLDENKINTQMRVDNLRQNQSDRRDKSQADAYMHLRKDMETFRGNAGAQQASKDILSADKAVRLVEGKDPNTLTVQDLRLLSDELGKVATGGVPTEHGVQGLMPDNLQTKFAEMKNFLSSNPTNANAGEYIKHNMAYLKDMRDTAKSSIDSYRSNIAKGYRGKISQSDYEENQNDYGLNQQSQRQPATSVTSEDQKAIDWAKANTNDPRAQKILKLHGM
jgi:hypothetical protein